MSNKHLDVLIHNELFSETMTEKQFEEWVQAHMIYMSRVSLLGAER